MQISWTDLRASRKGGYEKDTNRGNRCDPAYVRIVRLWLWIAFTSVITAAIISPVITGTIRIKSNIITITSRLESSDNAP